MKSFDVVALGELLIDFTEYGVSGQGNTVFEANPGGAPCNVLAMLSKLGHRTAFVGKVGEDFLGRQLKAAIEEADILSDYLLMDPKIPTTLAFVHTGPDGDRDFSFYRNPGADMMLDQTEIPTGLIKDTKIFHFGTLSMTQERNREATKKAIEIAGQNGALLSFDPNLRLPLWESEELAKEQILYGLGHCDVLKISDDELMWLTGREDYDEGISKIREKYQIPLILVSMGKEGSRAYYKDSMIEAMPFLQKETVETTGAGDTFCACILHTLCEKGLNGLSDRELYEMLVFANAAASIITTRKGALRMMPQEEEVYALLKTSGFETIKQKGI
ncbi:MAG: carbohydrate kinase [Lachnospiraceae bacterium]|jgi:fructokinase|nr:carbohydrate kinase [Lachnospiraceae bacterium]